MEMENGRALFSADNSYSVVSCGMRERTRKSRKGSISAIED